ncbi:acetylcholine receptor subunit alpha-L1-like isoform X1 [Argopecten irradians]|uniref:acetylcholine receptor subunit alpha-L1-like isoform X1 n=1 Tax=Argopecten irradians TaxID=31199 RepID=UPI00371712FD
MIFKMFSSNNCRLWILIFIFGGIRVDKTESATANDVSKLHDDLFRDYRKSVRPVRNQDDAVILNISFFIIMIHDLDLKNQVLTTNAWLRITWHDEFLHWNKTKYGGLTEILVSRNEVWTPDLLVENTAFGYHPLGIDQMLISLDSAGTLIWEPGIVMQTICEVNIAKYPFDSQNCAIRVMSWMHTNKSMIVVVEKNSVDITGYYPNGEWDLFTTSVKAYSPEDGSYNSGEILPGAEAILELRRRPVYYIISTILPISMLSLLNVLVFMLPMNTGEKMTLAVTVLLSFTVFMSVVNDVMPKTSNSISILAVYLTILLTLSGLSVASTVMVLHFHHREKRLKTSHVTERVDDVVHNTRLYKVCRPNANNNRRKTTQITKNGLRPSTEKLLQDYMEIDDSEANPVEENCCTNCVSKLARWRCCTRSRKPHKYLGKEFAQKLDNVLFCIVTILTVLSTVIAMILLIYW